MQLVFSQGMDSPVRLVHKIFTGTDVHRYVNVVSSRGEFYMSILNDKGAGEDRLLYSAL